ncbi:O-antigen export system permease protein RfbA [Treponema primitia ZAS-2]|uniref:Transport permease protein n=1 Tax=Treponema primitia (strain ATCC BAA-887 / DSM 12427 / ZAS-2) TaxID=545694 RepID=F5YGP0_TREPZ|nr:ABC transporter permease [Treponema primitia]AEF86825.1 O-antigen export system permease protein RfbA [Treponema primitia ZAS-2]
MNTLKEIYNYRYMLAGIIHRELRGRYKGSVLGFLWTFINPFLQFVVYTFVFSTIRRTNIPNFSVFLFVAFIPWTFFSMALHSGCAVIIANGGMVKKIYFPREVLPIAFVTTNFINMLYCFVIVFAVVFISGVPINPVAMLYLPLIMIIEYLLALAITFITSAITVYFRDVQYILSTVSMLWMFLTPLFYSIENVPKKYQKWYILNPMTPIVEVYRDILYRGKIPDWLTLVHAFAVSVVCLCIGIFVFQRLKKYFAEEL